MKPWIKWQDISMKLDIKVETHNKQQWNQQSVTMKEEASQRRTCYGTES